MNYALVILFIALSLTLAHAENSTPGAIAPLQKKKAESVEAKAEAVRSRKDLLENEIRTLNKINKCDGDGECEAIEMGARHCGGPSSYVVTSTNNPKYSAIKTKAAEFTAVEKELNLVDPPDVCSNAPSEPYAKCTENECKAVNRK